MRQNMKINTNINAIRANLNLNSVQKKNLQTVPTDCLPDTGSIRRQTMQQDWPSHRRCMPRSGDCTGHPRMDPMVYLLSRQPRER